MKSINIPAPFDFDQVKNKHKSVYKLLVSTETRFRIEVALSDPDNGTDEAYSILFNFFMDQGTVMHVDKSGNFWGYNNWQSTYRYNSESDANEAAALHAYNYCC